MNINSAKLLMTVTALVLLTSASGIASELDQNIESAAKKSYVFRTYLNDAEIKTESMDGAVTLTGTVSEDAHKSLAQETVANLPGVKSVDNQLVSKGEAQDSGSDGWVSMQVKYALLYNRHVSGMNTKVYVTDGVVTLRGEAENQAQMDLAGEYAKDIKGVKAVKNEMTIAKVPSEAKRDNMGDKRGDMGDKIDDASVTAQVKMSLLSHKSTSFFKTGVETNNGVVTLSGNATSAAAKAMISKVANDVSGVARVINNMTVDDSVTKN